jgi:hypothetical protein
MKLRLKSPVSKEKPNCKKLKGVKSYVVKNEITHQTYLKTLRTGIDEYIWQNSIRSFKHQLYSIKQKKKALTQFDDKLYICDDGIHTLTHGHKDIPLYTPKPKSEDKPKRTPKRKVN